MPIRSRSPGGRTPSGDCHRAAVCGLQPAISGRLLIWTFQQSLIIRASFMLAKLDMGFHRWQHEKKLIELYRAVAEVLAYVYRLRGRR